MIILLLQVIGLIFVGIYILGFISVGLEIIGRVYDATKKGDSNENN